jgi:RNA polymerase sigma-70 factor, ECF subfamily
VPPVSTPESTPVSLLERLCSQPKAGDWDLFVELYTPMLYSWARRLGLDADRAADLLQEVFTVLVRKLPEFRYDPARSFRKWLRTVFLNKMRELNRGRDVLGDAARPAMDQLADDTPLTAWIEQEYRQQLIERAVAIMRTDFSETTWRACWETVVGSRPPAEVAAELGVSLEVVYQSRTRVLRRLRQELRDLLD